MEDEMTENEKEELANSLTQQTLQAMAILDSARQAAMELSIEAMPYMVALYTKFVELKGHMYLIFGKDNVDKVLEDFGNLAKNGELGGAAQERDTKDKTGVSAYG